MSELSDGSDYEAREFMRLFRKYLGEAEQLLDDKQITDIYRNPHSEQIFTIHATKGKLPTAFRQTLDDANRFVGHVAAFYNSEFSAAHPRVSKAVPYLGIRLHALRSPIVAGTTWVMRKPTQDVPTLASYSDNGIIPDSATAARIRAFLSEKLNLLIAGPMGSGKTTLLNAVLSEIDSLFPNKERYALIEDTDELRCTAIDHIKMMTVESDRFNLSDYSGIGYPELVADALRLSATRIIVGELRYGASVLLDAWRTGHPGNLATIHGSTPDEAMGRLEFLLRREGYPIDRREIMATIQGLIVLRKIGSGRIVKHVVRITGVAEHGYLFKSA